MDVGTIRIVVAGLLAVCLLSLGGVVFLAVQGHEPSHALGYALTSSLSTLVGILVTPSAKRPEDGRGPEANGTPAR